MPKGYLGNILHILSMKNQQLLDFVKKGRVNRLMIRLYVDNDENMKELQCIMWNGHVLRPFGCILPLSSMYGLHLSAEWEPFLGENFHMRSLQ